MIGNHIDSIAAEFTNLLKENRVEGLLFIIIFLLLKDLARMYRALVRFEEGEARLVQMMEAYVDEVGSAALRDVCQIAKAVGQLSLSQKNVPSSLV